MIGPADGRRPINAGRLFMGEIQAKSKDCPSVHHHPISPRAGTHRISADRTAAGGFAAKATGSRQRNPWRTSDARQWEKGPERETTCLGQADP